MSKIEERIAHLKSDIEELRITADQSLAAYTTSAQYSTLLNELHYSSKNLPIAIKTMRQSMSSFLEYLRDRIAVIQKISPETAKRLNEYVKLHEKLSIEVIELYEKSGNLREIEKNLKKPEFQGKLSDLIINVYRVQESVEMCYKCFLDTLSYLESEK
ncbi:MAG TPA: hypothetical protein ENH95_00745 [Nitrosopumilus sp.]|nr:hypothetical protein [Nitrosopumilus sp.]